MIANNDIVRVHRSRLLELPFSKLDVLTHEGDKAIRKTQLEEAMTLGNQKRQSVKILFKTSEGLVGETDATVWSLTKEKIELKGGKYIPISAVISVGTRG